MPKSSFRPRLSTMVAQRQWDDEWSRGSIARDPIAGRVSDGRAEPFPDGHEDGRRDSSRSPSVTIIAPSAALTSAALTSACERPRSAACPHMDRAGASAERVGRPTVEQSDKSFFVSDLSDLSDSASLLGLLPRNRRQILFGWCWILSDSSDSGHWGGVNPLGETRRKRDTGEQTMGWKRRRTYGIRSNVVDPDAPYRTSFNPRVTGGFKNSGRVGEVPARFVNCFH